MEKRKVDRVPPLSTPRPAEDALTHYRIKGDSELSVAKDIAYNRPEGYSAKLNVHVKYGSLDVIVWNASEVRVYEVKFLPTVNDIAHALGQILLYREQFKDKLNRKILFIIYARVELPYETHAFLKRCCARYGVILYLPLIESERQAFDMKVDSQ